MNSRHESAGTGRVRGGFTLIELVVVLTIIAILTTIGLLAAHHVRQNSQMSVTRDLIRTLDTAYQGVVQEKSANVPAVYRDDSGNELAVIDACAQPGSGAIEPSQGLFVLAAGKDSAIVTAIQRADSKYVNNGPVVSQQFALPNTLTVPILKDPWNNPIRFVHPRYAGRAGNYVDSNNQPVTMTPAPASQTFQRAGGGSASFTFIRSFRPGGTLTSADEGLCSGNMGYFYSDGWDSDAGTRDNNVYTTVPQFPKETATLTGLPPGT
jgi:prepilin-type N-terminal cleavage/methylation domain-containing protein